QNDVTLKMPAFEWVHVQLHQQKGMISLSPPTICNSALKTDRNFGASLEVSKEKKVTVIVPHCEEIPEKLLVHTHNSGVCHR
ncbi:hypothetical protein ACWJU8_24595, partial [Escherichia coli]|nr:hypothetical protein [Escherichia coli]